jgi:amino acid transporter
MSYRPQRNGLGTAGFVLGLVGLVFSPIPIVGVVAWPLVILGLILATIGYRRTRKGLATNTGLSIAGMVLSIIGLVICIIWLVAVGSVADDAVNQANQTVTISYDAGGDSAGATVDYTTFSGDSTSDSTAQVSLPWHKDVQATGFLKGGVLIVSAGPNGGTVTCKVTVSGKVQKTATATGPLAVAECSNF